MKPIMVTLCVRVFAKCFSKMRVYLLNYMGLCLNMNYILEGELVRKIEGERRNVGVRKG